MFRVSGALLAAACVLSVGSPVLSAAGDVLYQCEFAQERRGGNYISPEVFVRHNTKTGKIEVIDAQIQYYIGSPVPAKLTQETDQRIGFSWTLNVRSIDNTRFPMEYRLTIFKDGRPAQMSAAPGGYDNSFSGSGSCKVGKS